MVIQIKRFPIIDFTKMDLIKKLSVLVLSMLAITSCNRRERLYVYVPEEVQRAFLFQKGTYWVYRDSLSGAIDSVVVRKVDTSTYFQGDDEDLHHDLIVRGDVYRLAGPADAHKKNWYYSLVAGSEGAVNGHPYPFRDYPNLTRYQRLSQVTVEGIEHKEVGYFDYTEGSLRLTEMLKERLGYIKYKEYSQFPGDTVNVNYNLLRWHIVQ